MTSRLGATTPRVSIPLYRHYCYLPVILGEPDDTEVVDTSSAPMDVDIEKTETAAATDQAEPAKNDDMKMEVSVEIPVKEEKPKKTAAGKRKAELEVDPPKKRKSPRLVVPASGKCRLLTLYYF